VRHRDSRAEASPAPRWPLLTALVLLLALAVYGVRALLAATGGTLVYTLDDAYTHMAMARTFAVDGVWGCTPHAFGSASSSPAWVVALALADVVTGGVRESAPLVLNLLFACLALVVADRWLRRAAASGWLRLATLVGLVIVFPMAPMTLYGMEHLLHGLLTLAFAGSAAWALGDPPAEAAGRWRDARWLAVLGALLAASRYEGFFLVGIVCLAFAASGRLVQGLTIGLVSGVPALVLGTVSIASGSLLLPNPLVLKAGGDGASPLAALFKPIGPADWAAYHANPGLLWVLLGALAVAIVDVVRHRTWRRPPTLLAMFLAGGLVLHQHFAFSSAFWVYRYDAYLLLFAVFALGVWLAGSEGTGATPERWRTAAAVVAVVAVTGALGHVRAAILPEAEAGAASLTTREHQALARFADAYFPGQTIVVNDIGVMAYRFSGRPIDMFGLCDVEPVRFRQKPGGYTPADVRDWANAVHAQVAIVQLTWGWVPPLIPAEWRKVAELTILPEGRVIGFFVIDPAVSSLDVRGDVGEFFTPLVAPGRYALQLF
jgi:hypothetical protein